MTGALLTVRKKYTLTRHPVLGLKIYIRAWRVRLKPDNFFVLPSVGAKLEVFRLSWEHTQKVQKKKLNLT